MSINLAVVGLLLVGACGQSDEETATLTVAAASSLTEVMTELAESYEQEHPSVSIRLNFASSSTLAEQIRAGSPIDLFAPADPWIIDSLDQEDLIDFSEMFAFNTMVIATHQLSPHRVRGLSDLSNPELFLGLCAVEVPCGRWSQHILSQAEVEVEADTYEPNVRALRTKIATGELDAGIIYYTDLMGESTLKSVYIPLELQPEIHYLMGVVEDRPHLSVARRFAGFLTEPEAVEILRRWGFLNYTM